MTVNERNWSVIKDDSAALPCDSKMKPVLHQLPVYHTKRTRFKHTRSFKTQNCNVIGLAQS